MLELIYSCLRLGADQSRLFIRHYDNGAIRNTNCTTKSEYFYSFYEKKTLLFRRKVARTKV
jgi:hypothetical protein